TALYPLSLHDALPIFLAFLSSAAWRLERAPGGFFLVLLTAISLAASLTLIEQANPIHDAAPLLPTFAGDLTSAALLGTVLSAMRSEEHTSELQSRENL